MLVPESELGGGRLSKFRARTEKPAKAVVPWAFVVNSPARFLFDKLFLVTVLIPTLLSIAYFGFLASDVYISESRFVVRMPQRGQATSAIGALLQGTGFQRAHDDSFTVHDFMTSRDALKTLDLELKLRESFSDLNVDFASRFPRPFDDASFESLYKYYGGKVAVIFDASSSITTLTVRAFEPDDAFRINQMLLAMGEGLVNRINDRGRADMVKYATDEVADAEAKAKASALALASYRNRRAVFDPDKQSALQLQQVTKLQDELVIAKLQLAQIKSLSPANPQIGAMERRASGLEAEMARQMSRIAGPNGNSLTDKATEFERLQLERTFADRQVAAAMTNLETARSEARRQQIYLERIVQPNKPDLALEPRRARAIFATLVVGLVMWGVLSMLLAGVKEHRD